MDGVCLEIHDLRTTLLSTGICIGLIISYLPQFIRIIQAGTSEGFSPWFLLLGATSSTSGMLNLWILQWPTVKCCRIISGTACFEQTLGIAQVTLQWACFILLFVLYIAYFPQYGKYVQVIPSMEDDTADEQTPLVSSTAVNRTREIQTPEWRSAVTLGIVVIIHLSLLTLLTVVSLMTASPFLYPYAQFLGVSATILTVFQYAPQILKTYQSGVVGALSIPMMLIQVPGCVMFVGSLVGRPGVEWSAWLTYAFAGSMQAVLLFMCLVFKARQRRLGQDDFGNPLIDSREDEDDLTQTGRATLL